MKPRHQSSARALQRFEPEPNTAYTIETTARITHVARRDILVYSRHGLVSPGVDAQLGYYFTEDEIRTLRYIEYLRSDCGVNLAGIKVILRLTNELERLRH